jgi:hypothetical protein
MKAQTKDAVAMAMDWLAQLRDEDGAEPPPGDKPATDSAPATGDLGDAPPAAPPAGEWQDAAPAEPPAVEWGDAAPAAPPAVEWGYVAPAAPQAGEWGNDRPAAPAAADFVDAGLAAPSAIDSWRAATPPAADSWPAAAAPAETTSPGRAGMQADIEITERAAIGDELRIPLAWCEMGSCISHYADPAALGEADNRTRAIAAGWRVDALGRLACPQCQQGDSWFWTAHPVALWDRDTAVAMTTVMALAAREIADANGAAGMEPGAPLGRPGAIAGGEPAAIPAPRREMARPQGRGRHRGHPARADRAQ